MKEFMNIPNILTVIRVLVLPFFIWCLFQEHLIYKIIALAMFLLASLTDLVDGYLARKWNQETEFGKFLDPLADKILVIGSFITFIILSEQIELWMVLLIILRDMMITSLRYLAIRQGTSVRTTMMGKVKTTFQMGAIISILLLFALVSFNDTKGINKKFTENKTNGMSSFSIAYQNYENFIILTKREESVSWDGYVNSLASFLPYWIMLITTFITVLSGIRYLISNSSIFKPEALKRSFGFK